MESLDIRPPLGAQRDVQPMAGQRTAHQPEHGRAVRRSERDRFDRRVVLLLVTKFVQPDEAERPSAES